MSLLQRAFVRLGWVKDEASTPPKADLPGPATPYTEDCPTFLLNIVILRLNELIDLQRRQLKLKPRDVAEHEDLEAWAKEMLEMTHG